MLVSMRLSLQSVSEISLACGNFPFEDVFVRAEFYRRDIQPDCSTFGRRSFLRCPPPRGKEMHSFESTRKSIQKIAAAGVAAAVLVFVPTASFGAVDVAIGISVGTPPPALPVYTQPICPGPGYIWTPGYWAYSPDGYYWVPGVWVVAPGVGMLWTPPYWGWSGGAYVFHAGYWGPHVGFYGGVNYGFGYGGVGFEGGEWRGGAFAYNRAVTNVNVVNVTNVYNKTVVVNNYNRVSYNGGNGGLTTRATAQEQMAMNEHHFAPTVNQMQHEQTMRADRNQWASVNRGRPQNMAMSTVNARENNQQQRIANGVRSGQLTPGETRNLENREANINRQVSADRAANGGSLTPQERQQVNREQNNVSRSINDDKHNAATDHFGNSEVGQRQANQQQRIANGISSGQMTAGEASRAENHQAQINQQVHADRQANGGHLTQQEHQQVNHEQNQASRQVYNEKHNDQKR